jgi:hypothetical protein
MSKQLLYYFIHKLDYLSLKFIINYTKLYIQLFIYFYFLVDLEHINNRDQ